jgi:hypothetical protein
VVASGSKFIGRIPQENPVKHNREMLGNVPYLQKFGFKIIAYAAGSEGRSSLVFPLNEEIGEALQTN